MPTSIVIEKHIDPECRTILFNPTQLHQIIVNLCTNARQALAQFREQPDRFDLLITDQTMPVLTGADLAQAVLELNPSLPIILCTGYSDTLPEKKALAMGIKKICCQARI